MAGTFSIDISEQFTRLAHLSVNKGKIDIHSLGYDNTVPNFFTNLVEKSAQEQSKVISLLHSKLNIPTTKVHAVLPDDLTYSQLLLMPDLPEKELVNSIRIQADEFVPLPIQDVYIDLETIAKLPNGKLLIVFIAAQKKIVDHVHLTLEMANLEPVTLENELSAVGRLVSEMFTFIKSPTLIVNFGYGGTSMYVMNPPFPYFQITRTVRIGYDLLLRDIKVNMNLDDAKAVEALKTIGLGTNGSVNVNAVIYPIINEFMAEIEKTLLLTKEKYNVSINNIYLFNYDNHVGYLHEAVQNKVSIPTQSLPLSSLLVPNTITQTFSNILSSFIPVIATHIR
ncbi:MAG: pilus assembly protein PilM [bacterium]|nr:pilus assembly protein PilM [bacterium]